MVFIAGNLIACEDWMPPVSPEAPLRPPAATIAEDRGVHIAVDEALLSSSDQKELVFWSTDRGEGPEADLFENVIYKSRVMIAFQSLLDRLQIRPGDQVLKLGAGHGWASVMAKSQVPTAHFAATDLSTDAIRTSELYEGLIGARLDEKWACSAVSLPFSDNRFDLVFCFAAFDHFIIGLRYEAVLRQVHRVLKPGGRLVMLYEPSAPPILYGRAKRRTESKRHVAQVDEDVILIERLRRDAENFCFDVKVEFHPEYSQRIGIASTVYYYVLSAFPLLQKFLPCTINTKPR
ncbi:class I SAM-dependent methyltransferase [Methylobacterium sp. WL30]|uniref:class I SAM-dependent methyltransferase n=1 Tax=unclassified Methylobacterium TaxID=2615210 RepID=UPI0011CBFD22|nr:MULTISPECIES: class I SAM-dependent methyltransferase [unclassified Methylobacterium]TXN34540.1 class I SAM-dependent methyltransferase [Methylobacterium sp. WL93]TXN44180.1 class I SAM-dependent methyltransferase [Methylobacterium sp. WL119]TXN61160.1 class I SAM-dependent methyltransferase [Methylobacterium sp. WL30]